MVTERWAEQADLPLLAESLSKDAYHTTTKPEFFFQPGTVCKVYEDEKGPVMFVRGTKALRIDIQFRDNADFERNRKILVEGFGPFAERCKASGFTELVFCSNSPLLKRFCKRILGFEEVEGEMRKYL